MKRSCPVNHCANRIGGNGVMCKRCWEALPESIQHRALRASWDWWEARRGKFGTAESIAIETTLHQLHAIQTRHDAINAAGFARRGQRIPPQLFGPHHRAVEAA